MAGPETPTSGPEGYYSDNSVFSEGVYPGERDWLPAAPPRVTVVSAGVVASTPPNAYLAGTPLGIFSGSDDSGLSSPEDSTRAHYYSGYWAAIQAALYGLGSPPAAPLHPRPFFFAALEQPSFTPQRLPSEGPRSPIEPGVTLPLTPAPGLRDLQNFQDPISTPEQSIFDVDQNKIYTNPPTYNDPGAFEDLLSPPGTTSAIGLHGQVTVPNVNVNIVPMDAAQWMNQSGFFGNTFQSGFLFDQSRGNPLSNFRDEIIDPTGFFPDQ